MSNSSIKSTDGDLDLYNRKDITALPEGLTVGGSLVLRGTGITALPEGLTVGGYLYLSGTGITGAVTNCGNEKRTIHPYFDKGGRIVISLGCFIGNKDQAIAAISRKYSGKDRDDYVSKVELAFANFKPSYKSAE